MKKILLFLGVIALQAQQVALSDTLTNAVGGGSFTGRITVTLSAPGNAQPLYYSTNSLTGWQAVYCLGVTGADCTTATAAGAFAATLYANSTITPAGTSYSARFQPTKGSAWSETWTVEAADTKLYQVRTTTVPSPTVMFQPSQLTAGGATNGQCLIYDGTVWEPGACASGSGSGTVTSVAATVPSILAVSGSPITTSGTLAISLATQSANQVFAGPTTGAAATPTFRTLVDSDIPNTITIDLAATATALATNGANCSAGQFPLGVDASGASETCTALPTTIAGTANQITASASTGAVTLSIPNNPTLPGTTTGTFSGNLTGNVTGNASTATALAANPTACTSGQYVSDIAADGTLTCSAPATAWGSITGTLSAQTDLQSALDAKQASDADLTAISALTGSGLLARTGSGTYSVRTITGTANQISVSHGNGVSQDPVISLPSTITGLSSVTSTAFVGALTGNASTATALAANPTACTSGQYVSDIAADGTLTCSAPAGGGATVRTTYASLPTCDGTKTNYQYIFTDSIYSANCDGSSYAYWAGQKYIPTLPWSDGTSFGTGATVTATTGSVLFDAGAPTGGDSIRAALKAIPTAPYTIILDIDLLQAGVVGSSSCGLVISNGTTAASSDVITLMQSYVGMNMTKLTNATSWDSNYIAYGQATSRNKLSIKLVDDNTNRTWSVSQDRINWTQVSQQSRTDFLTATHYGYGCNMTGVSGVVTMVIEGVYAQ